MTPLSMGIAVILTLILGVIVISFYGYAMKDKESSLEEPESMNVISESEEHHYEEEHSKKFK